MLFALGDVDFVNVVVQSQFLKNDGNLAAVGRRPGVEIDHFPS